MPGIAFFTGLEELIPVLNRLIRQFYIDPVLQVKRLESGKLSVENIGGMDASPTRIPVLIGRDNPVAAEAAVPALAVGASTTVGAAGQSLQPVTEYREGCFILGPPQLWDKEPPEFRPNATTQWPVAGPIAASIRKTFDTAPDLSFEYDDSGKEGDDGNVTAASCPIPATNGRACELEFDLSPVSTYFYGNISVGLLAKEGQSQLNLNLSRGDHEPGVYMQVSARNCQDVSVHERVALIIEPQKTYKIKVRYMPTGYMRVALLDEAGEKLWDTGEIPTYGEMQFDQIRFGIESGDGCQLRWDEQKQAMFLRGMWSDSSDVISGYVDNIGLDIFKQ